MDQQPINPPPPQGPYGYDVQPRTRQAQPPYQIPRVQVAQKDSALAVASLVLGISALGLSPLPGINVLAGCGGLLGLIFAAVAVVTIPKHQHLKGEGMAIAGAILSGAALVAVFTLPAAFESTAGNDHASSTTSMNVQSPSNVASPSSSSSNAGSSSNSGSNGTAASSMQDMALGTAATFSDGLTVTVLAVTPGFPNYDGTSVSCVTVEYKNDGKRNASFGTWDWSAQDAQGAQRGTDYYFDAESPLGTGELVPGGTVTGNLYFDEPIAKIVYSPSWFSSARDVSWLVS